MTLAIAAEYPWGEIRDVLSTIPGSRFDGAVILAADTRWSYDDGSPPQDRGRKLWTLGRQVGLVLAGDVWCGEEGIRQLRDRGQNSSFKSAQDVASMASEVFRETYAAHTEHAWRCERPPCGPLLYLMGIVDRNGYTALVRLTSDSDFAPVFLTGVHAIGVESAVDSARRYLLEQVGRIGDSQVVDPNPWALAVAGAIGMIIDSREDATVGGRVQIVVGDKSGWREVATSVLAADADFEVNENWTDTSYALGELQTAESSEFRRLASTETSELRLEQIA